MQDWFFDYFRRFLQLNKSKWQVIMLYNSIEQIVDYQKGHLIHALRNNGNKNSKYVCIHFLNISTTFAAKERLEAFSEAWGLSFSHFCCNDTGICYTINTELDDDNNSLLKG